jgi:DNA polymerase III subunit gamma/tau
VKDTLQKAIEEEKTVWAYLLCWPRWTGKTSTARILAKSVNCVNPIKGNPCLKCNICLDFAEEKLMDIIEIDAASLTWVDNIREIIEKAQFLPTHTKYKIYIIDEVHMLSKSAFNALLKILEEPPEHVKFILATTETHKVPETIISRCQRYDFKRISDEDIKNRLWFIAKSEKIITDEKAIDYIIKNSSGWLRNAISLFEQLTFNSELRYEKIVEQLEIVDENIIDEFLNKLIKKDSSVIKILDKNIADWKNIKLFFKELLFYTKNKSLELLKNNSNISEYINILDILDETYSKTKNSLDENTTFLIWILRILNWNDKENPLSQPFHPREKGVEKTVASSLPRGEIERGILKEKPKEKIEISTEDLNEVFWDIVEEKIMPKIDKTEKEQEKKIWNFNTNIFISKLKEKWAKWWLTMALRWSILNIDWETLMIWAYTRIAKEQVENATNYSMMKSVLKEMWFTNPQINFNLKKWN